MRALVIVCAALLGYACGGEPEPEVRTGTASLRFEVSNGVRRSQNLVDELRGTIYGNIYAKSEVTLTGPVEGATQYEDVTLEGVDLTEAESQSQPFVTKALPVGEYMFLGFFDVDGNGTPDYRPDAGDPVTLPVNEFRIRADQEVTAVVTFDLVFN